MSETNKTNKFPDDFIWGVSTASHQVEGGNYNQWTVWELAHANERAKTAQKRIGWLPKWDEIKPQATDPNNYVSGSGVEHYKRYKEDFDIAQSLNFNAFRFSVEWSRIEPEEGRWDEAAIEHYRTYIKELKKRGLEPFFNIWHWTNPIWFEEKGGFIKRSNQKYFLRFVRKIVEEYGDELNYVIILNEPNMYAWFSFAEDRWPAPAHSLTAFVRAYLNLMSIHRKAYKLIKKTHPHIQVSSAPQFANNVPADPRKFMHRVGAWTANYGNNWLWLKRTKRQMDFIGFNCYFKNYMTGIGPSKMSNPKTPVSDLGWYLEPSGVAEMVMRTSRSCPGKPIIITENGVADAKDEYRQWWIEETVKGLVSARMQGADIRGYFHWSLLDNFEWGEGWWPKFGLVEVDRKTMKRTIRPSAKWFANFLKKLK